MNGIAMRKELHSIIDAMPDQSLPALMSFIAEAYWKPVIETDLTEEEHALIQAGIREYKEDPSSFITLEDFKKRLQAEKERVRIPAGVEARRG